MSINAKKQGGIKKGTEDRMVHKDIYALYKFWKSIPAMFKGLTADELNKRYGIEDPMMHDFSTMRTQGDFAKRFKIAEETLSDWNKRMDVDGFDFLAGARAWAEKLTKNVVVAHYSKIMRKFDPISADLWYKAISGFSEKREIKHTGKLSILELVEKANDPDTRTNRTGESG